MAIDDAAFPGDGDGITKREWATIMVLQGMLAGGAAVGNRTVLIESAGELAEAAMQHADRNEH
jgi:hypothetical protein